MHHSAHQNLSPRFLGSPPLCPEGQAECWHTVVLNKQHPQMAASDQGGCSYMGCTRRLSLGAWEENLKEFDLCVLNPSL